MLRDHKRIMVLMLALCTIFILVGNVSLAAKTSGDNNNTSTLGGYTLSAPSHINVEGGKSYSFASKGITSNGSLVKYGASSDLTVTSSGISAKEVSQTTSASFAIGVRQQPSLIKSVSVTIYPKGQMPAGVGDSVPSFPPPPYIVLTPNVLDLEIGETKTVKAQLKNAGSAGGSFRYSAVNSGVARVSTNKNQYTVTGLNVGETVLTCYVNGYKDISTSCKIRVRAKGTEAEEFIPITSISLPKYKDMIVGEKSSIAATISPSNATDKTVDWASSNSSIVSVSGGRLEAKQVGVAQISATKCWTDDHGKLHELIATCIIYVREEFTSTEEITSVAISGPNEVEKGKMISLNASIQPANAKDKNVVWESSDPNIARVSFNGLVVGYESGTVTIKATSKADPTKSDSKTIKVVDKGTNFSIEPRAIELDIKGNEEVRNSSWSIKDKDGKVISKNNFTFSISGSDRSKIYVSGGTIVAKGEGSVTLTATAKSNSNYNGSDTITINVINSLSEGAIHLTTSRNSVGVGDEIDLTATLVLADSSKVKDYAIEFNSNSKFDVREGPKTKNGVTTYKIKANEKSKPHIVVSVTATNKSDGTTYSDSVTIQVTDTSVSSGTFMLYKGSSIRIKDKSDTGNVYNSAGKSGWDNDNPEVCTIEAGGKVSPKGVGTAHVRGYRKENDGSLTLVYSHTIIVYDITFKNTEMTYRVGDPISVDDFVSFPSNVTAEEKGKWIIACQGQKGFTISFNEATKNGFKADIRYNNSTVKQVTIKVNEYDGITVETKDSTITSDKQAKFTAKLLGSLKGNEKNIKWEVSDNLVKVSEKSTSLEVKIKDNVFSNNENESVIGTVSAIYGDYSASANITITRPNIKGIEEFKYEKSKMGVGSSQDPIIVWNPKDALLKDEIKFSSDKPDKVAVDSTGRITALEITKKNEPAKITLKVGSYSKTFNITVVNGITWSVSGIPNMVAASPDVVISDYVVLDERIGDCETSFDMYGYINVDKNGESIETGNIELKLSKGNSVSIKGSEVTAVRKGVSEITITNKTYSELEPLKVNVNVITDLMSGVNPRASFNGLVGSKVTLEQLGVSNEDYIMKGYVGVLENHNTYAILKNEGHAVVNYYRKGESEAINPTTTINAYNVGFGKSSYTLDGSTTSGLDLDSLTIIPSSKLDSGATYSFKIVGGSSLAKIEGNTIKATGVGNDENGITVEVSASGTDKKGTTKIKIINVKEKPLTGLITSYTGLKGTDIGIDYFLNGIDGDWTFTETGNSEYLTRNGGNKSLHLKKATEEGKPCYAKMKDSVSNRTATVYVNILAKEKFEITTKNIVFDNSQAEGIQTKKVGYIFEYGSDAELVWSLSEANSENFVEMYENEISAEAWITETLTLTGKVYKGNKVVASDTASVQLICDDIPGTPTGGSITLSNIDGANNYSTEIKGTAKSYKSSDANIAYVDGQGKIVGKSAGTATITGYSKVDYKGDVVLTRDVTVIAPAFGGPFEGKVGTSIPNSSVITNASEVESVTGGKVIVRPHKSDGDYLQSTGNAISLIKANSNPKNIVVKLDYNGKEIHLGQVSVQISKES